MTRSGSVALSVQIGLRIVGIWPGAPHAVLLRGAWILTIGIILTLQYWWIVLHFGNDDMSYLLEGLSVTTEYTMMLMKLIILWLNSRIFYDALATMAGDWKETAIGNVRTMTSKANLSRRLSNVIIGLYSAGPFFYCIGVFVSSSSHVDAIGTPAREFVLKMQLPFGCNESPLYELITGLEFVHLIVSSIVAGILNSLIITLVLHASGQIDILCDTLKEIRPKWNLVIPVMKELIGKHQRIIVFSNRIEKLFCYVALIQFIANTLITCCLGYMIVASISAMRDSNTIDSTALIKAVAFYMAALAEAFIICSCGEYLSAKSKMIGDAAYRSVWYNFKSSESKLILLIILRSQRRLTITAGKIIDLSLEEFTTIVKASVSYISVLHAMY